MVKAIVALMGVQLKLTQAYAQAGDAAASQAYLAKSRTTAQQLVRLEPAMGEAALHQISQAEQSLRGSGTRFRANPRALDSRELP